MRYDEVKTLNVLSVVAASNLDVDVADEIRHAPSGDLIATVVRKARCITFWFQKRQVTNIKNDGALQG